MESRNATIEFYRYIFMVVLLMWHGPFDSFKFKNGYLVVEFFFILSGYMLMNSFYRKPKTALLYTVDKLKKMYFTYFMALCLACLYFGIIPDIIIQHSISANLIFPFITETLLLQGLGIFDAGINWPMWYFSVLIIGGYLLYSIISTWKDMSIHVLIPILSIITLTYLRYSQNGSLEDFTTKGIFHMPLWRGIAEMGIGIMLCCFCHSRYNKMHKSIWIDCIVMIILVLITFILMLRDNHQYDIYAIIFFSFIIYAGIWNKGFLYFILNNKLWIKLGGVTYEIYLLHAMTGSLAYRITGSNIDNIPCFLTYVTIVTMLSFVFKYGCQKLQYKIINIAKQ